MFEQIMAGLSQWKAKTSERQKLQHTYVMSAVLFLLVAGLISLLDNELGQSISYLALASIVAFLVNGVIWHLVVENVTEYITTPKKAKK